MSEHQHVSYIWIFPLWIYLTKSAVNTHQKFKLIYLLLNCIFCLRIFEEQSFFFVFLGTIQRSILILFRRNSPLFSLWSLATIVCDTCVISAVNETCECILELSFHWIKRNKDNLRDLWDNVKCPNIQIIGVPEEEDRKTMRKYLRR